MNYEEQSLILNYLENSLKNLKTIQVVLNSVDKNMSNKEHLLIKLSLIRNYAKILDINTIAVIEEVNNYE